MIGGHQPLRYYPAELDALYLAVIREPISRVLSSYSYCTRTDFAEDIYAPGRRKAVEQWRKRGIDPDSLVNSLRTCAPFRERVSNLQCRYLSRGSATYEDAMDTLSRIECMVCDIAELPRLNAELASRMGWGGVPTQRANRSKPGTEDALDREPEAREIIEELAAEDLRLYDAIRNDFGGLYSNVSAGGAVMAAVQSVELQREPAWGRVHMFAKGYVAISPQGTGSTITTVVNDGTVAISPDRYPGLSIYYQPMAHDGTPIQGEFARTAVREEIPGGGRLTQPITIDISAVDPAQVASIQVGLALAPDARVADRHPLHGASLQVLRTT
ncbi:MAG: hypothetical protein R3228_02600 [Halioglobus sp.]|nr:hypothetical protein [Halioglobus sp.]